jgi:predicted DNA-binding transcriptional regulator AlpA
MPSPLITEREAAERLGVSVRTMQAYRQRRIGPRWLKLGGSAAVRYMPEDLEEYVRASARETATSALLAAL